MFVKVQVRHISLLLLIILFSACKETSNQNQHRFTNDLVHETSPYLLQHAHNPVNWRAWNDDVISEAEKENKLILISIGYSSCHWCHVMERETFEDEAIAAVMNENFINIKVDREERPDIDQVYQTAAQLTGKNGGWPLNAITLPNGKPIYLGTYHTNEQWKQLLEKIYQWYLTNPDKANELADQLAEGINETSVFEPSSDFEKLTIPSLELAVENWKTNWDLELGGDKGLEKFPIPINLSFLLDYALITNKDEPLTHVKNTLDEMANGGIYDHLGGGFFRYSTDPKWKVPHFEKMLYDNAQLIELYSKAYKVFKEPRYKEIVFETVAFLNREMKNEEGGYYAALDAESEGKEGKFYIWQQPELESVLGSDFALFSNYYSIEASKAWEQGNFVLHKNSTDEVYVTNNAISKEEFLLKKQQWKEILMKKRAERIRPNTDDKVLTSWNALLISGLVEAYNAFGNQEFLDQAVAIHDFLKDKSYTNATLKHSHKKGSKSKQGFLEDYAFFSHAAIQLYKVSLDDSYLDFANALVQKTQEGFLDSKSGMYKFSDQENLISNLVKTQDGDIPSPNSVMAHSLFQLSHLNYNVDYLKQSKTMLTTILHDVQNYGASFGHWNHLLLKVAHPYYEIAVVGPNAPQMVEDLNKHHLANTLIVGSTKESELPLFEDRYFEDETYIFVCQDRVCKLPVTSVDEALNQLNSF